jgi:spermidine synthase
MPGGGGELRLYERGGEFSLRLDGRELMASRAHGSEDALGELAAARLRARKEPSVLIGGLGLGYTLAAVLRGLGPRAAVLVAELVPAVVEWNRGPLAHLAGHPLRDARVRVATADVAEVIRDARGAFDAVLLDVDNGPGAAVRPGTASLYGPAGLAAAHGALRPGGLLGIWAASEERRFTKRLRAAGFHVELARAGAWRGRRGGAHVVWLAEREG